MKNFKKSLSALLLALTLLVSAAPAAGAVTYDPTYKEEPATVTFKGDGSGNFGHFEFAPGSIYSDSDLFPNLKNVFPGDTLEQDVTIKFEDATHDPAYKTTYLALYMRAVPHVDGSETTGEDQPQVNKPQDKVMEYEKSVAEMNDFLSQLDLTVKQGETVLFEGKASEQTIGKEARVNPRLGGYVFLGNFRADDFTTLTATLEVPITMGNEYANRVGEVDWEFYAEAFDETRLQVKKVWSNGNDRHEDDEVIIHLLKDGEKTGDKLVLNALNDWKGVFEELLLEEKDEDGKLIIHEYTVEEEKVPGYNTTVSEPEGNVITVTNTKRHHPRPDPDPDVDIEDPDVPLVDPEIPLVQPPVQITVNKVWAGEFKNRPSSVTVVLYNGTEAVDAVVLSAENNWTHTWSELPGEGNWMLQERNVPKGFVPSYHAEGGVVTITNTATLIQTGQLNWPVLVLLGVGAAAVGYGLLLIMKKKRSEQ